LQKSIGVDSEFLFVFIFGFVGDILHVCCNDEDEGFDVVMSDAIIDGHIFTCREWSRNISLFII